MVDKRITEKAKILVKLENLFESPDALDILCQKSGGYVRNLMQLMQAAVKRAKSIPIPDRAVNLAISELRKVYHDSIYADDWQKLAEVSLSKGISQDGKAGEYRELLFRRCILEYSFVDENGNRNSWQNVHPLIETMDEFIAARDKLIKEQEAENVSNSGN
jgi:hypothetical protein